MVELFANLQDQVLAIVDTPWILLVVMILTTIDGFFPPVPSESIVIAAAVLIVAGSGPHLGFLLLAAAAGAYLGDIIAFTIGRHLPIEKIPILRGRKAARALAWADRALQQRATVFLMSARFIPIGRVAVNVTAGTVGFPRRFFLIIDAFAAVFWALYSVGLGLAAGAILKEHPLLGILAGVAGGVVIGYILDFALKRFYARYLERKARRFSETGRSPRGL
ncbi:MAG: VTT domain-containing protein [Bowdeniella nasicola]|nr:VTT domain-containing protein [Bowdeniella nasicola]